MVTSGSTGSCGGGLGCCIHFSGKGTNQKGREQALGYRRILLCTPLTHTPRAEGTRVCVPDRALCLAYFLMPTWTSHWPVCLGGAGTQEPLLHSAEHLWGSRALTL